LFKAKVARLNEFAEEWLVDLKATRVIVNSNAVDDIGHRFKRMFVAWCTNLKQEIAVAAHQTATKRFGRMYREGIVLSSTEHLDPQALEWRTKGEAARQILFDLCEQMGTNEEASKRSSQPGWWLCLREQEKCAEVIRETTMLVATSRRWQKVLVGGCGCDDCMLRTSGKKSSTGSVGL